MSWRRRCDQLQRKRWWKILQNVRNIVESMNGLTRTVSAMSVIRIWCVGEGGVGDATSWGLERAGPDTGVSLGTGIPGFDGLVVDATFFATANGKGDCRVGAASRPFPFDLLVAAAEETSLASSSAVGTTEACHCFTLSLTSSTFAGSSSPTGAAPTGKYFDARPPAP